jgi:hypothetical protein
MGSPVFSATALSWLAPHALAFVIISAAVLATTAATFAFVMSKDSSSAVRTSAESGAATSAAMHFGMGILLASCCGIALLWEGFTYHDGDIFFAGLSKEYRWYDPPIWASLGRFFPLGHQEFRLLASIDSSGSIYHIFAIVELGAACFFVASALRSTVFFSYLLSASIFTTPAIVLVGLGLIFPERNVILLLSINIIALAGYLSCPRPWKLWIAIFSAFLVLFFKETSFVAVGAWASTFVAAGLFRKYFAPAMPRNRDLYLVSATLAGAIFGFLALYLVVVYPLVQTPFTESRQVAFLSSLSVVTSQIWFWALCGAIGVRFWLFFKHAVTLNPVWEGAALAALGYASAITILRFPYEYYTAPAAFLAWVYCGHICSLLSGRISRTPLQLGIALLSAITLFVQVPGALRVLMEEKELVHSKADAAQFINSAARVLGAREPLGRPIRLYVVDAGAWEAGLFGNFLRARYGLDVVIGIGSEQGKSGRSRCLASYPVECIAGMPVKSADLAVEFLERGSRKAVEDAGFKSIYVSEAVGFWRNRRHARVLVNIDPLGGGKP